MSGILPGWIERLLGIETSMGEGTRYTLEESWSWAPWATLLFAAFTCLFVFTIYFREGGSSGKVVRTALAMIRISLVAIVLVMLAEFVLSLERTGLPYMVVMVDESVSMETADQLDQEIRQALAERLEKSDLDQVTRLNLAKALLLENEGRLLRQIADDYRLKLYFVGEDARPAAAGADLDQIAAELRELEPSGSQSRLGRGIRRVLNDLRGAPPAAIVFLTDGITTEGESIGEVAATYARRKRVPLFLVGLGSEKAVQDLRLHDALYDDVVFKDDVVNIDFKATGHGYSGRRVKVRLLAADDDTEVASQDVTVGPDGQPTQLRLPFRPDRVGEFEYVVEIEPQEEEIQSGKVRNNRLPVRLSVRDDKIKVLFVQSYPSHEWHYLKILLDRDSTVDFKTVLQEADPNYASIEHTALPLFPVSQDELNEYHVLIFGDVDPTFMSTSVLSNINQFVQKKGGGVAFICGPRYTPLAYRGTPIEPLFPIDLSRASVPPEGTAITESFQPRLTRAGMDSPHMQLGDSPAATQEIWESLPGLYWLLEARKLKGGARVLAEHPDRRMPDGTGLPVIAMQYAGAGKVLFHATDDTWRWRYQVGDIYLQRYWVQAVRYLARSRLLTSDSAASVVPLRETYERGETVRLRVRFFDESQAPSEDDGVKLIVESEGQKNRRLTLLRKPGSRGIFEGELRGLAAGDYHAWLAAPAVAGKAPAADFHVEAPATETGNLQMDVRQLEDAGRITGGAYYDFEAAEELSDDLPQGKPVPIEPLPPVILWNRWPLLVAFLGLLVGEWLLRKRQGML